MVNVRWLWIPLVGASVFLAVPGNETIGGMLGDVVGHFFSSAMVAVVPAVVGYRLIFKTSGKRNHLHFCGGLGLSGDLADFQVVDRCKDQRPDPIGTSA